MKDFDQNYAKLKSIKGKIEKEIEEVIENCQEKNEYKAMYEAQIKFLELQNGIFLKNKSKIDKKKQFDQEFIKYGIKNNQFLNQGIQKDKELILSN